jgi:ubiquinone/menaquinone biosynthesis C-methylase UbiE
MRKNILRISEDAIRKIYNEIAVSYENHRIYDPNQWDLVEFPQIQKLCVNLNNKKVFDAGCGTGIFIKEILKKHSPKEIIGMDISEQMLRIANKRCENISNIQLIQGNIIKTNLGNSYFDFIYSFGVLHYLEDLNKIFKEFYRILKKKGKVIFSVRHPVRNLSYLAQDNSANYFIRGWHKERWPGTDKTDVYMYYRPLEEWINSIIDNKFKILKIFESKPEDNIRIMYPEFYGKYTRIPRELLCIIQK